MILFLALTMVACTLCWTEGRGAVRYLIVVYLSAFTMLSIGLVEVALSDLPLLKSDELFYVESVQEYSFREVLSNQRALWLVVNYWVIHWDIGLGGIALKVLNIPVFVIFTIGIIYAIGFLLEEISCVK